MKKRYIGDVAAISSILLMIFVFLFVVMDNVKAVGWKAWSILASMLFCGFGIIWIGSRVAYPFILKGPENYRKVEVGLKWLSYVCLAVITFVSLSRLISQFL
jgi:hypothetical protein